MTPTLRRLNDRERYWGLTWPGWAAATAAGGVLYAAVKLSPFGVKPTVTIAALTLAVIVVVMLGISGQALSPGRQLHAVLSAHRRPRQWTLPGGPLHHGLVLSSAPDLAAGQQPARDSAAHTDPPQAGKCPEGGTA